MRRGIWGDATRATVCTRLCNVRWQAEREEGECAECVRLLEGGAREAGVADTVGIHGLGELFDALGLLHVVEVVAVGIQDLLLRYRLGESLRAQVTDLLALEICASSVTAAATGCGRHGVALRIAATHFTALCQAAGGFGFSFSQLRGSDPRWNGLVLGRPKFGSGYKGGTVRLWPILTQYSYPKLCRQHVRTPQRVWKTRKATESAFACARSPRVFGRRAFICASPFTGRSACSGHPR